MELTLSFVVTPWLDDEVHHLFHGETMNFIVTSMMIDQPKLTPTVEQYNDNCSILSNTSSNVITNEGAIVELNAAQSALAVEVDKVDIPDVVTSEFIQDEEEVEETKASSRNINRIFECPIHLKPNIGMVFPTLQLGIEFYGSKNKYRMIFGPFTEVDHHKRCVIFGAGLIINEHKESFAWLFNNFLDAMGGRHPVCLINDEDPGIEEGLKLAWKDKVQHRYCMWHILKKLPEKVRPSICKETEFLKEINSCVWDEDVEPHEFEESWTSIVESHGLSENEWLKEKYCIRQMWIPAYFRGLFLGGLMRTTSRSESENHFFSNFTNPNLTLVEFWMQFESAMDAQQWTQSKFIAQSKNSSPLVRDKQKDDNHVIDYIDIIDQERNKTYVVGFKMDEVKLVCTCKKFERHGILCRHILCVLKDRGFKKVPSEYP
ncbi:protein FAR1-RELATED SEQUENCE 5-like [Silene latifolia]|uniref:protein FAR1-RELATED SEQUENCE 5-like n=1 Tax=Silene latifolia TaxID=37657 RepID=UPI003D786880